MKNKKEQLKELYSKFKTAWANPRKKAGIQLLGYLIFFIILFLFAAITSNMNKYKTPTNQATTTTLTPDKYNNKQKFLLTNKYSINYVINVKIVTYIEKIKYGKMAITKEGRKGYGRQHSFRVCKKKI